MKTQTLILALALGLPQIGWASTAAYPATAIGVGEYQYKTPPADSRKHGQAFAIGKPKRTDFVFFTDEEEETLWSILQSKIIAEQAEADRIAKAQKQARNGGLKLVWPRVVVEGSQICVPELAHSDSNDWRDHLTCWDGEGK